MTGEELAARVERLEQIVEKLPMDRDAHHPFWDRIPFSAWLKLSGPAFAVMALGFGVLWNGQQQTTQRILDLQESTTDRILELQRTTTERLLGMQQQILDLQKQSRADSPR